MTETAPSVRPATVDDAGRIGEICATAYRETYRGLLPPEYIERTIRDFYGAERVRREVSPAAPHWLGYQVVEEGGRVLGAAGGGMTSPTAGELFVVYLDPVERGRGLGTLLLERVTEQLRAEGAVEMWVSVFDGNVKGIPFYEARGFLPVEWTRAYASLPEEEIWSVRMRRHLSSRKASVSG